MLFLLLYAQLAVAETPPPEVTISGDVKTFAVAVFPYDHLMLRDPEDWADEDAEAEPSGQGIADLRLKVGASWGAFDLDIHHSLTSLAPGGQVSAMSMASTGVGASAPEAVDLSWEAADSEGLSVRGRIDRLVLSASLPHVDLAVGRQPITFGRSLMFTPLDLVGPFNPTVIDQEYKPGVDAVRVDVYAGMSGQISLAAAYAGTDDQWDLPDLVFAGYGTTTVGVWDLGAFLGLVHQDAVMGLSATGSIGVVGLRAEGAFTLPPGDSEDDPFVRAAVGADFYPGGSGTTVISTEFYLQTLGADDPSGYLEAGSSERVARGEIWLAGQYYGAVAVSQEIIPIVSASGALICNLADPSCLLVPSLSWSVSDEAAVSAGAYFGMGQRPEEISFTELLEATDYSADPEDYLDAMPIRSELGLIPAAAYLSMRTYF